MTARARPERSPLARRVVATMITRPRLWWVGAVQVVALARPGWWRRWPPVPRPDVGYLRFRCETAYGDARAEIDPSDVVEYLAWCREARLTAR